jgi:choline dehydrogenase-like flavoprotein
MVKVSNEDKRYDYIVVGAGAAGSVLAPELSASGAQVLVVESGGPDDAPTIMNPSIWFYKCCWPLRESRFAAKFKVGREALRKRT